MRFTILALVFHSSGLAGKETHRNMLLVQKQPNLNRHILMILKRCKHVNHLKQLQAFLITVGQGQTQYFAFKLVRFCTLTLSNLEYARFIFDRLKSPNVYLYTAMITAYASQFDHRSGIILYRTMVRRGFPQPNHFIYPHALKCCPAIFESHGTKSLHVQILKWGFGQYPVVQTALVDSYSKFRSDLKTARELFDEMAEKNVVAWTAMISGYTRHGEIGNAVVMFEHMPERDIPSWNALIAGCTQNGFFSEAISLFKRMLLLDQDIKPNGVTVVCALSACSHTGMLQLGRWIHGYAYRSGLVPDSFISNALVDMYGKCGNLKEARIIFEMTSKRDLTSWNSMINCYALHGQSETAITVFEEMMMQSGDYVKPDEVTFVSLLNACTHGGLVDKGQSYFELMTRDYGIEARIEHYGCLIDLLSRAGRFEEAIEVVRGMRIEPDEVVWGSLLNGCKIYGLTDLAEYAVKKLIDLDPKNGGYRTMLANIYGELGKWDEVGRVRKMLKEWNAHKVPGCSWIEFDNQVHQFYSDDKTHSKIEDIYKILECLVDFY